VGSQVAEDLPYPLRRGSDVDLGGEGLDHGGS
jgi:hypothetical protein